MYGISFELNLEVLKKEYGNSYHCAYEEVRHELGNVGFEWTHGSVYINQSNENSLTTVYKAISRLSKIEWFRNSVRDIRAFKVEDWSDFTEIVKSGHNKS